MEIGPAFADVRWQEATGREAVLDETGLTDGDVAAQRTSPGGLGKHRLLCGDSRRAAEGHSERCIRGGSESTRIW